MPDRPGWYQAGAPAHDLHRGDGRPGRLQHGQRIGLGVEGIDRAGAAMHIARHRRAAADAGRTQRFVLRAVAGIGMADLRQGKIGKAAVHVAPGRRDQVGQQRRPHVGEFRGDGIGQLELGLAAAEELRVILRQEGPGHGLVEAARGQHAARRQHALLQHG